MASGSPSGTRAWIYDALIMFAAFVALTAILVRERTGEVGSDAAERYDAA